MLPTAIIVPSVCRGKQFIHFRIALRAITKTLRVGHEVEIELLNHMVKVGAVKGAPGSLL